MQVLRQLEGSRLRKLAVVAVLLVFSALAFTQVAHSHPGRTRGGSPDTAHCSVCIAAHNTAAATQASVLVLSFASSPLLAIVSRQPHSRLVVAGLFIRPPPSSL